MGLPESLCTGLGQLLPLALYCVGIDAQCVHVAAVTHQELQLAVVHGGGVDAHKGVAKIVKKELPPDVPATAPL